MNVVYTIAGLSPEFGGPSHSVPALAEAIARENIVVDLVACAAAKSERAIVLPQGARVRTKFVSNAARRFQWFARTNQFFRAVTERATNESVIHDNGLWLPTNHAVAVAARVLKRPFLISPRGMLSRWERRHRRWKKEVAWILFQRNDLYRATALHATSANEANDFRTAGYRGPIAVVPNGVAIPTDRAPRAIGRSKRNAICITRIHPKKGLHDLIDAWRRVKPNDWRMIIAGHDEDRHREELEIEIRKTGLSEAFEFIGPVEGEQKQALFCNADLFILPSHSENFGMVIAEALAYGVPVITTRGTPWEDLIKHRCGWWEEIGVDPLARALRQATTLPAETRDEMGKRGRELVAQKYSWSRVAKEMQSVYGWLVGQSDRPQCVVCD